jgi:hypothetical protein
MPPEWIVSGAILGSRKKNRCDARHFVCRSRRLVHAGIAARKQN